MTDDMDRDGLARGHWEDVLIIQSMSNPDLVGHRVSELADQSHKSPEDWLFDALIQTNCESHDGHIHDE